MVKRTDKEKHEDMVAAYFMKNPHATVREAAKDLNISKSTIAEHRKQLDKIGQKDERIVFLTDSDFAIMQKIQAEKEKRLDEPEKVSNSDLDKWDNTSTRRYSLFVWDATDSKGWVKDMRDLKDDELLSIINWWQA